MDKKRLVCNDLIETFDVEGSTLYSIKFDDKVQSQILENERAWRIDYDNHIPEASFFPYTVSPATFELMNDLFNEYLIEAARLSGIEGESGWAGEKIRDIGQRVMTPDAYWLISNNAHLIADRIRGINEEGRIPIMRSLGFGAGVFDRSVLELNSKVNVIGTDLKLASCVRAGMNMALADLLNPELNITHHILIDTDIPGEYLDRIRDKGGHVLIQKADVLEVLEQEQIVLRDAGISGYDIVAMDNFLPYLGLKDVERIFRNIVNLGRDETRIQFLGLERTRVQIALVYKLRQIFKGSAVDRFKKIIQEEEPEEGYMYGYPCVYRTNAEGNVTEVISPWAGAIYDWMRELVMQGKVHEVLSMLKQINSATGLSDLVDLVKSTTGEHFKLLCEILEEKNIPYEVIVEPGSEEDGILVLRTATIDTKN